MDQTEKLLELKRMLDQQLIDERQFKELRNQLLQSTGKPLNPEKKSDPISNDVSTSAGKNNKRKFTILSILAISLIALIIFLITSQKDPYEIEIPTDAISVDNQVEHVFQPQLHYERPVALPYPIPSTFYEYALKETLYPIGWSQNGKFAFLTVHPNEASTCERAFFLIQDMVTDKILCQIDSRDFCEEESENFFPKAWMEMQQKITAKLNEFQIEQQQKTILQKLPYVYSGISYDIHLYNRKSFDEIDGMEFLAATTIHMKKDNIIGKKLFGQNYKNTQLMTNGVVGYIKSPFENRIAILYLTERRGYEGPPTVVNYELIGCEINNGY